jgi:hypothetical protein
MHVTLVYIFAPVITNVTEKLGAFFPDGQASWVRSALLVLGISYYPEFLRRVNLFLSCSHNIDGKRAHSKIKQSHKANHIQVANSAKAALSVERSSGRSDAYQMPAQNLLENDI